MWLPERSPAYFFKDGKKDAKIVLQNNWPLASIGKY